MAKRSNKAPERWHKGHMPYTPGLTLDIAKKMLDAAEEEADRQGVPMVMAIADSSSNLVAFRRMDGVMLASINIALDKAFTAVMGKQPTWHWTTMINEGGFAPLHVHERFIPFPGGFPIKRDDALYGGIGVSGGIIEDLYVAKAALAVGGYDVDEVEDTIARLTSST
jgi:uncharacterized protein GlcG (DUF336 family)